MTLPLAATPAVDSAPARRRGLVLLLSALAGFLLTVVWSAEFVDQTIGSTVADTMLGRDADATPIAGTLSGIVFAFASGLAGSFTACNIAALGAVAPLVGARPSVGARIRGTLRPLGWLAAGALAVSGAYGVVVGIVGTAMPQFATAGPAPGTLSPGLIQAMVTFGLIGLAFLYLGLAALGYLPDPLARHPRARMAVMGALIGGFLIGRPFPLFRQLFRDAAESHNPLYGALAFMLQSAGNIVVMSVLFVLLALATGGRAHRWLTATPTRLALITGAALVVAGVFTLLYWDVRILARRDLIWYPTAPWS
ncbi:hypothetical protein [Nonomuraea sp. NPDC049684]|uniref:hypothetical protein n=1 Tax=unclassified Nonomuraea TaxID=2593643 RepID=UPI0037ABC130